MILKIDSQKNNDTIVESFVQWIKKAEKDYFNEYSPMKKTEPSSPMIGKDGSIRWFDSLCFSHATKESNLIRLFLKEQVPIMYTSLG